MMLQIGFGKMPNQEIVESLSSGTRDFAQYAENQTKTEVRLLYRYPKYPVPVLKLAGKNSESADRGQLKFFRQITQNVHPIWLCRVRF